MIRKPDDAATGDASSGPGAMVRLEVSAGRQVTAGPADGAAAGSGARIIAFPRRPVSAEDPEMRLRRALAALDAALSGQHRAVLDWQKAVGALRTSTTSLRDNLVGYQADLDTLGKRVGAVRDQAERLAGWADDTLAATTGSGKR